MAWSIEASGMRRTPCTAWVGPSRSAVTSTISTRGVSAIQFSLDDGATWTSYDTDGAVIDKGVNWHFDYTPTRPGRYVLKARAVDKRGVASVLVSRFAFEVLP